MNLACWAVFVAISATTLANAWGGEGETAITGKRYVSSSAGDDRNDGASPDVPWKTLSKVCEQTFGPGAVIHLKRGDTWNEAFIPRGNGDPAADRWITVKSYGPADDPKPVLEREGAKDENRDWAIKLVDLQGWRFENLAVRNSPTGFIYLGTKETAAKRGLRITGCEFSNIRGLPTHTPTGKDDKRKYWWMRGSPAIHISGPGFIPDGKPCAPEFCEWPEGVEELRIQAKGAGLSDVVIQDVLVDNATYGIAIIGGTFPVDAKTELTGSNYRLENLTIQNCGCVGMALSCIKGGVLKDCTILHSGRDGLYSGTIGVEIFSCQDVTVEGGEIAFTVSPNKADEDGGGVYLGGWNRNVRVQGVKVHDTASWPIAVEGVRDYRMKSTYVIANNRIWKGALKNDDPAISVREYAEFLLAFWNASAVVKDNWVWRQPGKHLVNVVTDPSGQWLAEDKQWKDELSLEGEMRFPEGWVFSGNRDASRDETNPPLIPGNAD